MSTTEDPRDLGHSGIVLRGGRHSPQKLVKERFGPRPEALRHSIVALARRIGRGTHSLTKSPRISTATFKIRCTAS
jgi:hypothetical protein